VTAAHDAVFHCTSWLVSVVFVSHCFPLNHSTFWTFEDALKVHEFRLEKRHAQLGRGDGVLGHAAGGSPSPLTVR